MRRGREADETQRIGTGVLDPRLWTGILIVLALVAIGWGSGNNLDAFDALVVSAAHLLIGSLALQIGRARPWSSIGLGLTLLPTLVALITLNDLRPESEEGNLRDDNLAAGLITIGLTPVLLSAACVFVVVFARNRSRPEIRATDAELALFLGSVFAGFMMEMVFNSLNTLLATVGVTAALGVAIGRQDRVRVKTFTPVSNPELAAEVRRAVQERRSGRR